MRTRPSLVIGVRSLALRIDPKSRIFGSAAGGWIATAEGSDGAIGCACSLLAGVNSGDVGLAECATNSASPRESSAWFLRVDPPQDSTTFHSAAQSPTATSSAIRTQVWLLVPFPSRGEPEGALVDAATRSLFPRGF